MVIKLTAVFIALASLVSAANYKRVACPDGVNTATDEAVRSNPAESVHQLIFSTVLRILCSPRRPPGEPLRWRMW